MGIEAALKIRLLGTAKTIATPERDIRSATPAMAAPAMALPVGANVTVRGA
jgi:hypothetical protein